MPLWKLVGRLSSATLNKKWIVPWQNEISFEDSDTARWLKVTLPKHKGVKSSGSANGLGTVSTGNVVDTGSTKPKQTKQTTDCKRDVAAVVPVDVVTK